MTATASKTSSASRYALVAVGGFVTLLGSLVLAELGVRFLYRDDPYVPAGGNHPRFLVQEDAVTGFSLRPGFSGTMSNPWGDFSVATTIDSLGNRDSNGPWPAADHVILGLGGSFTYGEGVPIDSTYLAVLEGMLRDNADGSFRLVKAGVPGFSAAQMILRFDVLAPQVNPDIVILGLTPSGGDRLDDPFIHFEGFLVRNSCRDYLQLVHDDLFVTPFSQPVLRALDARLQFSSQIYRRIVSLRGTGSCGKNDPPGAAVKDRWTAEMITLVKGFDARVQSIGARLLVVLVDTPAHLELPVAKAIRRAGIPCLRTATTLRRAGRDGMEVFFVNDGHWTPSAHELVATLIFEKILERELLSQP